MVGHRQIRRLRLVHALVARLHFLRFLLELSLGNVPYGGHEHCVRFVLRPFFDGHVLIRLCTRRSSRLRCVRMYDRVLLFRRGVFANV